MAGGGLSETRRWFDAHSAGAPESLRERAAGYLADASPDQPAERLADAAGAALGRVLAQPGDRAVALDLLAADALVTLALKAAAADPPGLGAFAARLRRAGEPAR